MENQEDVEVEEGSKWEILKSRPGITRILIVICNLAGLVIGLANTAIITDYFNTVFFVVIAQSFLFFFGTIVTTFFLAMYLCRIAKLTDHTGCAILEFSFCIFMILLIIAALIYNNFASDSLSSSFDAFTTFDFCLAVIYRIDLFLYIYNAHLMCRLWKKGLLL